MSQKKISPLTKMWTKLPRAKDLTSPDSPKCVVVLEGKTNSGKVCSFAACYANTETGETLCGIHYRSVPRTPEDPMPSSQSHRRERERKVPHSARIAELRVLLGAMHPQLLSQRANVEKLRAKILVMEADLQQRQEEFNSANDELSRLVLGRR